SPEITSKMLPKQHLNIRLVIDNENKKFHAGAPVLPSIAALRGRTMRNSVYSPAVVSTSIDPPCCLTMMSWLIERPSPVPSPAGLVVKKGSNICSLPSGGMPLPLSRILVSTLSPRSFVEAAAWVRSHRPQPAPCALSQHRSR